MLSTDKLVAASSKILIVIIALMFLFPFYWMLSSSFKEMSVAYQIPPQLFPAKPIITNYVKLLETQATRWLLNSIMVSVITTFLVIIISSMAAYALAKVPFRAGKYIFALFVGSMTLPSAALLIPQFKLAVGLQLVNTYSGLVIHALAAPYMIFLLRQFMMTIPKEMLESARIDGCSEPGIYWRIMLPLAKPGLGAIAIFTFVSSWNDYIWQLLIIKDSAMMTLPLGVNSLINVEAVDWGLIMAGSVLASLPVLIVFISFQKYFVQGLTVGAVKG